MFYNDIGLHYTIEIFLESGTTIMCAVKGIRWWTHRHQLHNIIHELSIQWENIRVQNILTIENIKEATNTKLVQTIFIAVMLTAGGIYILRPYIMLLSYSLRSNTNNSIDYDNLMTYTAGYPFAIKTLQECFFIITYQQITAFVACVYWVSCDILYATITTQITIQFLVLARRLESIIAGDDYLQHDDDVHSQLRDIAMQHNQLFG
ncbi:hypothetical protein PV327_006256 [Microctonus hyperodae]|uniref:Uncharacterized protein n=1 Tax=Microctonus hyperodae TaxID=165561 RepID=A0AA39F3X9_MICHY|nr:hypothetical protein PV327_006256 [Microctonus hyperodae]